MVGLPVYNRGWEVCADEIIQFYATGRTSDLAVRSGSSYRAAKCLPHWGPQ
ncbi:hypothetical protein LNQ03_03340 [Klebsiella pneumoniae subsp. pneumoniae]|nr:hypothetical protein [Klebsiella pneumoniae subsp. pneumoniae]